MTTCQFKAYRPHEPPRAGMHTPRAGMHISHWNSPLDTEIRIFSSLVVVLAKAAPAAVLTLRLDAVMRASAASSALSTAVASLVLLAPARVLAALHLDNLSDVQRPTIRQENPLSIWECVCVYYCSTYYKAVRVGGERE